MRPSQYSESQRRFALLAVEAGWTVKAVCEVFDITRMTLYRRLHQKLLGQGYTIDLGCTYRPYQAEKLAVHPMRRKADPKHKRGKYPKNLNGWQLVVT